jgi:hypothetical protein
MTTIREIDIKINKTSNAYNSPTERAREVVFQQSIPDRLLYRKNAFLRVYYMK